MLNVYSTVAALALFYTDVYSVPSSGLSLASRRLVPQPLAVLWKHIIPSVSRHGTPTKHGRSTHHVRCLFAEILLESPLENCGPAEVLFVVAHIVIVDPDIVRIDIRIRPVS